MNWLSGLGADASGLPLIGRSSSGVGPGRAELESDAIPPQAARAARAKADSDSRVSFCVASMAPTHCLPVSTSLYAGAGFAGVLSASLVTRSASSGFPRRDRPDALSVALVVRAAGKIIVVRGRAHAESHHQALE